MDLFWTIVVILVILWLLGFSLGLVGGLIHILLVVAIIVILVRIIQGRKPLQPFRLEETGKLTQKSLLKMLFFIINLKDGETEIPNEAVKVNVIRSHGSLLLEIQFNRFSLVGPFSSDSKQTEPHSNRLSTHTISLTQVLQLVLQVNLSVQIPGLAQRTSHQWRMQFPRGSRKTRYQRARLQCR